MMHNALQSVTVSSLGNRMPFDTRVANLLVDGQLGEAS
jgi:hypothetical protein